MNDAPIDCRGLEKSFGRTRALNGFDLRVEPGEIAGFLGPNGAGKSTTIRILLGVLRADGGTARVLGADPWADAVALHRRMAYVPGDVSLWPGISGGEIIDYLVGLRSTAYRRSDQYRRRRRDLLERFQLDPTKKAGTYSKGNRQKIALVAALSCDADLYLFDEPTSGLDPLMEALFTAELARLRDEGRTVLLSSHILGEVENACDTVTIIRDGRAAESGRLDELRHLRRAGVEAVLSGEAADRLGALDGVHDVSRDGERMAFTVDDAAMTQVLGTLADVDAREVSIQPVRLERLFLDHYESSSDRDITGEEDEGRHAEGKTDARGTRR